MVKLSYKTSFGNKRTLLLLNPVLQLPFLPRISNADSELRVECKPIAGNWDKNIPGSHCLLDHILLKLSIPNAILDWFVLLLPIVVVWNLQVSKERKLALSAVFLVGAL